MLRNHLYCLQIIPILHHSENSIHLDSEYFVKVSIFLRHQKWLVFSKSNSKIEGVFSCSQEFLCCFLSQKKTFDMCTVWTLWQKIQLMQSPLSFIVFSKFRTWGHKTEFYFIRVHYERVSTALLWYWTSGISNNSTCSLEDLKIKYSTATVSYWKFFSCSFPSPCPRPETE